MALLRHALPIVLWTLSLLTQRSYCFAPTLPVTARTTAASSTHRSTLLVVPSENDDTESSPRRRHSSSAWMRVLDRLDTVKAAGLPESTQTAGIGKRLKRLHGPKTYLLLSFLAGLKWDWCFRNPYYWFGVAFCIKWYRARYVFKIPVWDRQPNWNNIITSKEQEKDLKAFTCKNCGSTIFIAKTREFFFEGSTGIGGLGCFSCGAKGKDNFVMDRDRIVEDVADMDDYFEYERPLDFVSRAERRRLLKESGGDEDLANKLALEQQGTAVQDAEVVQEEEATASTESETAAAEIQEDPESEASDLMPEPEAVESETEDENEAGEEAPEENEPEPEAQVQSPGPEDETEPVERTTEKTETEPEPIESKAVELEPEEAQTPPKETVMPPLAPPEKTSPKKPAPADDGDIDILDMDDF